MTTETQPGLPSFVDWIRTTDEHADYHLTLLGTAQGALAGGRRVSSDQRSHLAERLTRWRYQHLNQHWRALTAEDEAFVDTLDLAANQLAGRAPRPPRATRHAIGDRASDSEPLRHAAAALDPRTPLDRLAREAAELTTRHFGQPDAHAPSSTAARRMLLYAPLYVSNQCVNWCTYCGFRYPQDIVRKHLTIGQAVEQAQILRERGFRHLLLVGGDFPRQMTAEYYAQLTRQLVRLGIAPAVEIAPQSTESYDKLVGAGICGLTLYQETYDPQSYAEYHPRGPKSSFHWRLESHDRAAEAGVRRLGLGILLGLADPADDFQAMMRHAAYLAARFPDATLAFSLPRIHEAPDGFEIRHPCSDDQLIRLYCALRIAFPMAELVLSTREPAALRDRLARICITQMSAGSSTAPGGYQEQECQAGEQFPVVDHRSPAVVARWLQDEGFHVAWNVGPGRPER